jgi:hypothetical protein
VIVQLPLKPPVGLQTDGLIRWHTVAIEVLRFAAEQECAARALEATEKAHDELDRALEKGDREAAKVASAKLRKKIKDAAAGSSLLADLARGIAKLFGQVESWRKGG